MHSAIFYLATCLSAVLVASTAISQRSGKVNRAIYTLSNDPSGAHILALALDQDTGFVSSPTLTSTGGVGLVGLYEGPPFGPPGSPAGPDSLFSQGAVKTSGNYLFTINPGSHTLSMFIISPDDLLHPRLVGEPIDTQGDFPLSVAYDKKYQIACVLNSGAKPGVGCFDVNPFTGLKPHGSLRPIADIKQALPPTGPRDTGSDILFNLDSTAIFVTVKGIPPSPGWIYAFPINRNGDVSATPVVSQISDLISAFSMNFLGSNSKALITDPVFGASIVNIDSDLKVTETFHTVIPNEVNVCWCVWSKKHDTAFVIDSRRTNITMVDPNSGAIKGSIPYDTAALGGYDTVLVRDRLYFGTADSSVVVVQLNSNGGQQVTGGQEIQKFPLAPYGPVNKWQGMASWPAHEYE